MRALIMSDSHGWTKEVEGVVRRHQQEVDVIFHCGDSELNGSSPALNSVQTVKGNCDFGDDFPEEIVHDVEGLRFFIGHGHLLNVKMSEMNLLYKAEETGADIVCFGHTHVPVATMEKGFLIVNPGSMRLPRRVEVGTYVIIEVKDGEVAVDFYSMDGKIQEKLCKTFKKN